MVFKKGEVANPNGARRCKEFPFTKKDIKHHFEEWKRLVEKGKMSDAVRLRATRQLVEFMCDRMYGRPHQALDISSDKPLAAIVNISLGMEGEALLRDENSNSSEVKALPPGNGVSGSVVDILEED